MREILFRGKCPYHGDWIYGQFLPKSGTICTEKVHENSTLYVDLFVDVESVGQYTGMKDKNGVKIFEGDMLKPFDDEFDKMVVEFHHGGFMLCIYGERGYRGESGAWIFEGNYGLIECELLSSYGEDIEVIGNIHDELKEVAE